MNRSILIVICDFLLVSLLAFSTVDINKATDEGTPRQVKVEIATNQVESGKDLAAVMRLALNDERKARDQLLGELTKTRETAASQQARISEQQARLSEQEGLLNEREKQVRNFQQEIQTRDQQAAQLQQTKAELQNRFAAAQTNIQSLNQQLQSTTTEASLSKEKLAALEAELRKQAQQAAALQQQLSQLASSNQVVQMEKLQLAGQLQVAQTEKRMALEQATRMQEEVKVEREEKAKLAEGVHVLASKSGQLAQEIRENRALAPNTIFYEFTTNRVQAQFTASRPGLLGTVKRKDTETVLVTDGTNTYAMCHIQDTPLALWNPGTDWDGLVGTLSRNSATFPIRTLSFQLQDPRIVWIPITDDEARRLGCKIYRISPQPYKFQEAVLVGAREGYYGECQFQIDLATPDYVKLDHNLIKGLFGKFNPSRGDLVFSRTGELLGVMANSSYCLMIHQFHPAATFKFGQDIRAQRTGLVLSTLYSQVTQLPLRLQ